jgi:hypothetical protein
MASAFESMRSYHQTSQNIKCPFPSCWQTLPLAFDADVFGDVGRAISWPVILTLLCHVQVFVMTLVMDPSHTVIQPHTFCSSPLYDLSMVP